MKSVREVNIMDFMLRDVYIVDFILCDTVVNQI